MAQGLRYNKGKECLRCGDKLNPTAWGDSHSNGTIHLDHPSQIFMHLLNKNHFFNRWQDVLDEFDDLTKDHPFYKGGHGQVANFEWKAGEMCESCHTELVNVVGRFFFGGSSDDISVQQSVTVNTGTMIGYNG